MLKALIPLFEGFEEVEAMTAVDVLRRGAVEVTTASIPDRLEVTGAHGVTVRADLTIDEAVSDRYDAIVLPGGPGTRSMLECPELVDALVDQKKSGRLLAAVCAAPTVLVELGLVEDETHITCYPSCAQELPRPVADVPVVADGTLITGQAPGSALLFALVVLKTLAGEETAVKVARGMVTDVL